MHQLKIISKCGQHQRGVAVQVLILNSDLVDAVKNVLCHLELFVLKGNVENVFVLPCDGIVKGVVLLHFLDVSLNHGILHLGELPVEDLGDKLLGQPEPLTQRTYNVHV